jgi:single-strand DNA-binding protein
MRAMAYEVDGPALESERHAEGHWEAGPRPEAGKAGTSVPEGPTRPRSRSTILGDGSLSGTLCSDPELRFSTNGRPLCKLRVAVSERRRDQESGKYVSGEAEYIDVTVWNRQAESVVEMLRKGDRVIAIGQWERNEWLDKNDQWQSRRTFTGREIGPSMLFRPVRVLRDKESEQA